MRRLFSILLALPLALAAANDPYFSWNGGTNRLMPYGFASLRGSSFAWHLFNPGGEQVLLYNLSDVVQSQYTEPPGSATAHVAPAWALQSHASNIVVAVIDDSFDLGHPDLAGRWWINPATGVPGIRIQNGALSTNVNLSSAQVHGTQAAGLIGAVGNNHLGVVGVCRDGVQIMPVASAGSYGDLAHGVAWAATNGAHIILFAYGYYLQAQDWADAFALAQQRGCLVVQATVEGAIRELGAPTAQYFTPDYPAMWGRNLGTNICPTLSNLLVVSCIRQDGIRYSIGGWSSNFVDVMYPGRRLPSTMPPSSYAAFNGTSPAAAVAAGHAALLMARFPNENALQIKARIMATVQRTDEHATNCLSGGVADVWKSMLHLRPAPVANLRRLRLP